MLSPILSPCVHPYLKGMNPVSIAQKYFTHDLKANHFASLATPKSSPQREQYGLRDLPS